MNIVIVSIEVPPLHLHVTVRKVCGCRRQLDLAVSPQQASCGDVGDSQKCSSDRSTTPVSVREKR